MTLLTRQSAVIVLLACCLLSSAQTALAQKKFGVFGSGNVTYRIFKDAAGRFELEYPTRDWSPVSVGGSAIAMLSRNDRTATVVVDLSQLTEPLLEAEIEINAKIELESLVEQHPNAKAFTSAFEVSQAGRGSLIRYDRIEGNGPERVIRYTIGVGKELYHLDAVAAPAAMIKHEAVLMHMIKSFKVPATSAAPAISKN
jgi:hypothetical protein